MKCLIIAAGKGSRLQQRGDSKPILGIALIERVIRAAMEAGAELIDGLASESHAVGA